MPIKFTRLKNILQIVTSSNKKIRKKLNLNNQIYDLLMIFLSRTRKLSRKMIIYNFKDPRAFLPVPIHSIDHFLDSSNREYTRAKIAIPWSEVKQCCLGLILIINLPEIMYWPQTLIQIKLSIKIFKTSNPKLNFIYSHNKLLWSHILSKLNPIIIFDLRIKIILKKPHK